MTNDLKRYTPVHFKWEEFDQRGVPGSGHKHMCRTLVKNLDDLREMCGFPIRISSAYRSPEYNSQVSSTGTTGPHTTGKAVDILCYGENALTILQTALHMQVFTGIGINQKGPYESRFIHLDTLFNSETKGSRPWPWTY